MLTLQELKEKEKMVEIVHDILPSPFITVRKVIRVGDCVRACTPDHSLKKEIAYQVGKMIIEATRDCIILLDKMSDKPIIKYESLEPEMIYLGERKRMVEVSMGYRCKNHDAN